MPDRPLAETLRALFSRDKLPATLMVAVGIAALGFTAWRAWHMASFLSRASRTTGVVVDARQHQQVRFTTADGRELVFIQNGFLNRPLGAEVPVAYDPADPAGTAQVETVLTTWVMALWTLPMGLGFTLLPLLGVRVYWRGETHWQASRRDRRG